MNRNDLAKEIMTKHNLSGSVASDVVDTVVDGVQGALRRGEKVTFRGIGILSVVDKKARQGRNPKTGEKISIPAGKKVKFKAAEGLLA